MPNHEPAGCLWFIPGGLLQPEESNETQRGSPDGAAEGRGLRPSEHWRVPTNPMLVFHLGTGSGGVQPGVSLTWPNAPAHHRQAASEPSNLGVGTC